SRVRPNDVEHSGQRLRGAAESAGGAGRTLEVDRYGVRCLGVVDSAVAASIESVVARATAPRTTSAADDQEDGCRPGTGCNHVVTATPREQVVAAGALDRVTGPGDEYVGLRSADHLGDVGLREVHGRSGAAGRSHVS